MADNYTVTSESQLREILGEPSELVKQKITDSLDPAMCEFIRRSPLIFLSTLDECGQQDVSPKGDAPGFVHIDEGMNILVPERPGNKLIYGFKNILRNHNVGLIFVVPTMRETLRVKGRATLSRDPAVLESLAARGKPALLCTKIEVSECFFHCGKAMIRSNMWKPDLWESYSDSLLVRQVAGAIGADAEGEKGLASHMEDSYRDNLY